MKVISRLTPDQREHYEERAAIREYCGGLGAFLALMLWRVQK